MKISHKLSILISIGILMALTLFFINKFYNFRLKNAINGINELNAANELILKGIIDEKHYFSEHHQKNSKSVINYFTQADQSVMRLEKLSIFNIDKSLPQLSDQIKSYKKTFDLLTVNISALDAETQKINKELYKFNQMTLKILEKTRMDIGTAMSLAQDVDENIHNIGEIAKNTQLWIEQMNLTLNRELFVNNDETAFLKAKKEVISRLKIEKYNAEVVSQSIDESVYNKYLKEVIRVINRIPASTEKVRLYYKEMGSIEKKLNKTRENIITIKDNIISDAKTAIQDQQKNLLYVSILIFFIIVAAYIFIGVLFLRSITEPFKQIVATANSISNGDFNNSINISQKGEIGILAAAFQNMQDTINSVLKEMDMLTQSVQEGKLNLRGKTENLAGGWRGLVVGVNNVFDAFAASYKITATYIEQISGGEIPEKIKDEYKGDFNKIKNNLNMLIDAVNKTTVLAEEIALGNLDIQLKERSENDRFMKAFICMIEELKKVSNETNLLISQVQEGRLNIRGNSANFKGGWQDLIIGVNKLIDAFVLPINKTAIYIDRISKGDIPNKINEEYKGDFNKIKNNINRLILNLKGTIEVSEKIAEGDLSVQVTILSDQDMLGQSLTKMVSTIKDIVSNINLLTNSALQGRLDVRGDEKKFGGEYAEIIKGVNNTLDAVVTPLKITADYVNRISRGDIPEIIKEEYKGDYNELRNSLNRMIQNLTRFAIDVQNTAKQVTAGSRQLSDAAQQISQGSSHQAASIEQISSSMEQISSMVIQNADNAQQTAAIALKTSNDAHEGGIAVKETVEAMSSISAKISIIEDIARQTNMLALNAAIEAARAGNHGKGFAVVAAEVRKLAEKSQKSAKAINTLSNSSLAIAEKASQLLANMVIGIQKTSELVQEISISNVEQSDGLSQINQGIQQLDQVIQENAASTEEMASASSDFSSQASYLLKSASFFKVSLLDRKSDDLLIIDHQNTPKT